MMIWDVELHGTFHRRDTLTGGLFRRYDQGFEPVYGPPRLRHSDVWSVVFKLRTRLRSWDHLRNVAVVVSDVVWSDLEYDTGTVDGRFTVRFALDEERVREEFPEGRITKARVLEVARDIVCMRIEGVTCTAPELVFT